MLVSAEGRMLVEIARGWRTRADCIDPPLRAFSVQTFQGFKPAGCNSLDHPPLLGVFSTDSRCACQIVLPMRPASTCLMVLRTEKCLAFATSTLQPCIPECLPQASLFFLWDLAFFLQGPRKHTHTWQVACSQYYTADTATMQCRSRTEHL